MAQFRIHQRGPQALAVAVAAALGMVMVLASPVATAEVTGGGVTGFEVREQAHVAATPEAVYSSLITPRRWWDSEHTYSHDAQHLTLEARAGGCWCETLPDGGSVEHMTVVYLAPNKVVRLRGALGPLQAMAVNGSMTIKLTPAGGGTDVSVTYAVGGYAKGGFEDIAKGVDAVLGAQVARLRKLVETGNADGPAH